MSKQSALRLANVFNESKFIAPTVDSALFLSRERLLKKIIEQNPEGKKLIFLQAQPGQGKTVFSAQLMDHLQTPFVWYQVTREDADPVFFLLSLFAGIKRQFPDFESPLISRMGASGEVRGDNICHLTRVLAAEISLKIKKNFFLVLDDLHVMEKDCSSYQALTELVDLSPATLKFMLVSRHAISLPLKSVAVQSDAISIENDNLLLSKTEISRLFNEYLHVPATQTEISSLAEISNGWISALLLMGEGLRHQQQINFEDGSLTNKITGSEEIVEYFEREAYGLFDDDLLFSLLKLSLFEEIDLGLARIITHLEIEASLNALLEKNLFIRRVEGEETSFRLHHLLQNALQKRAQAELPAALRIEILIQAGNYYLQRNEPIRAIDYFLQAGEFHSAEKILRQVGMVLLASNRTTTLAVILKRIPDNHIRESAWLCLYLGILKLNQDPASSYEYYEISRKGFSCQGDFFGEMLVLGQLIHFHIFIDGRHNLGQPHLYRLEELFAKNRELLDPVAVMRFAHGIAGGYCFFEYNATKTDSYLQISLDSAEQLDLPNYLAGSKIVSCYRYAFGGGWGQLQHELENSLPLLANPRVSLEHKLGLVMCQISSLILTGDFSNYLRKKEWLLTTLGKNISTLSVISPFLAIYDANLLIAEGQYSQAKTVITNGLQGRGAANDPHQKSQLLHFLALLEALDGRKEAAMVAARESRELRLAVGPGRFDALNLIVLGAVLSLLGDFKKAEQYLSSALETVLNLPDEHLTVAAYINRAQVFIKTAQPEKAKEDLRQGLSAMKSKGYDFFFGWIPSVLQETLQAAVDWAIEVDYVRELAQKRLGRFLVPEAPALPILKAKLTGEFSLYLGEKLIARESDLSPIQRQCLALLLTTQGHCLGQEQLQVHFWPESSTEKSRSSFDTMLSRLRKTLTPLLAPHSVKDYLVLQKGILRLEVVKTDIDGFKSSAMAAISAFQQGHFWQLENQLHRAMSRWSGKPLPNLPADDLIDPVRFELENLYLQSANLWANVLAKNGRLQTATDLLNQALQLDPTDHRTIQTLYGLHVQAGNPAQAGKVVQGYRENLLKEEYLPAEIEEILESLWESSPPA